MWRSKYVQAFIIIVMLTIVLSVMAFLQQGLSIRIVNTHEEKIRHQIEELEKIQPKKHEELTTVLAKQQPRVTTPKPQPKRVTRPPRKYVPPPPVQPRQPEPVADPGPQKNPIPTRARLNAMSDAELVNFYHSYVMSPQSTCAAVKRMGSVKDGGWEMCDDVRFKPDPKNCLVYSFGINFDFTYDDDMADYGCEIHAFDPSMQGTHDHLRGQRVHFHATGISGHDGIIVGPPRNERWKVYTMGTHRKMLRHNATQRRIDIVKMDIEGSEVDSLTAALREGSLRDIKQMSWEAHLSLNGQPQRSHYMKYLTLFSQLYDAGFRIYHTSRNHVWSSFISDKIRKQRVLCHEINMVNINNMNKPTSSSGSLSINPLSSRDRDQSLSLRNRPSRDQPSRRQPSRAGHSLSLSDIDEDNF